MLKPPAKHSTPEMGTSSEARGVPWPAAYSTKLPSKCLKDDMMKMALNRMRPKRAMYGMALSFACISFQETGSRRLRGFPSAAGPRKRPLLRRTDADPVHQLVLVHVLPRDT